MIASRQKSPVERLTDREREVLGRMADGRSNAAIAGRLHVSEGGREHINILFSMLDLPVAADENRRVLAVLAHLDDLGPA